MKTDILFGNDAKTKLLKGVQTVARAVGTTCGPRGQNVSIAKTSPRGDIYERVVLHDGVSVARAIEIDDEFENQGAQLLIQAARRQVDQVGDGTTVTVILASAVITEAYKVIASGVNPMSLRTGLEDGLKKLTTEIEKRSTPITTLEELVNIATISAEDASLGELVAQTLYKVGADGVVTVEESKQPTTTVEHQSGMQLDHGMYHPLFATNPERMEAVLTDARILITDKPITSVEPLLPLLEEVYKTQTKLLILTTDLGGDALPTLLQNKLDGKLAVLAVRAPSFGQNQKDTLQDIAVLTGGKFFAEDAGFSFKDITLNDLGRAEYVTATKTETIITGGGGNPERVKERTTLISDALRENPTDFENQKLRERLGKLTGGIAVIRVGGFTEVEMKERRERVLDAVAATRAAQKAGIVPGGEMIYLSIRDVLDRTNVAQSILYRALMQPLYTLTGNAGIDQFDVGELLAKSKKDSSDGIDVTTGQVVNMIESGIIDPALVSTRALENSISVAIQLLTTDCIIIPKGDKPNVTQSRTM